MFARKIFMAIASLFLAMALCYSGTPAMKSIQDYGVLPANSPETNRLNLQKAIDEASVTGAALYVTPVENGYPIASGIKLRKNVSLIGVHGPIGRGTCNVANDGPTGSVFVIKDRNNPFIKVESATQMRGIQFYYPDQSFTDPRKVIKYPATIIMDDASKVEGVTLSCLTFYGEWEAMDFKAKAPNICEQILFEHCYGYPLSGKFISIDRCYDIPRILHCHINPANGREFGRTFSRSIVDSVVEQGTYSYWIEHTDNAVIVDIFTFGTFGGIYLGKETYGQFTSFNFDCVKVGIYKDGGNDFNRDWMISQGSIIANAGTDIHLIHPFIITGYGHTSITNVVAFSGDNHALTNSRSSYDFVKVEGDKPLTLYVSGCRMDNYVSDSPITLDNENARIRLKNCVNKDGEFMDYSNN